MIEQAIRGNPRLKLNLTEVFRPGLTYTIDTLKALREKLGGNPVPLVLLMGQDQWANLKTWKSWQALTGLREPRGFQPRKEASLSSSGNHLLG